MSIGDRFSSSLCFTMLCASAKMLAFSAKMTPAAGVSAARMLHFSRPLAIKEGDKLPSGHVFEGTPKDKVNVADLFGKKRGILIGVPGAFTPGCSQKHLPTYIKRYDDLKKHGVEVVACIAVNDPFVMSAWGKDLKTEGKIRMLADTEGIFTKALQLDVNLSPALGFVRSKRFSMLLEDGKVKKLYVEPDNTGVTCTVADAILADIPKSK